ncbi:MAG: hypothetical protein JWN73_4540 [Betaproteobacteria bacterium]|nr:hypothetical protein [Betaproteobacteria bacterium]
MTSTSMLETTVEAEKAVENLLTPAQRSVTQRNRQRKLARLLLLDVAESGCKGMQLTQGRYELIVRPAAEEAPDA